MNDKIQKANKLQKEIGELKDLISLLSNGNKKSHHSTKTEEKYNEFSTLWLSAYLWTGTQNPKYEVRFENKNVISKIADSILELCKTELELRESELSKLFN